MMKQTLQGKPTPSLYAISRPRLERARRVAANRATVALLMGHAHAWRLNRQILAELGERLCDRRTA